MKFAKYLLLVAIGQTVFGHSSKCEEDRGRMSSSSKRELLRRLQGHGDEPATANSDTGSTASVASAKRSEHEDPVDASDSIQSIDLPYQVFNPDDDVTEPKGQWILRACRRTIGKNKLDLDRLYGPMKLLPLQGGCSSVSIGRMSGIPVVVKEIMKPTVPSSYLRQMMHDEVASLHKAQDGSHRNIAKLLEVHEDEHRLVLVMEMCMGGELFARCLRERPLSIHEKRSITVQVLEALDHIHKRGIIHADIKPSNFMMKSSDEDSEEYNTVELIDFGMAMMVGKTSVRSGRLCGTTKCLAPEVATKTQYSPLSDVWAAGVTILALWTRWPIYPFLGVESSASNEVVRKAVCEVAQKMEKDNQYFVNKLRNANLGLSEDEEDVLELFEHMFVKVGDRWSAAQLLESEVVADWKDNFPSGAAQE